MQTEQNTEDQDRAREIIKNFFEKAKREPGMERVSVLHNIIVLMSRHIVRLEIEMEEQEKLWASSLNDEHERAYHEGVADGKRARFGL